MNENIIKLIDLTGKTAIVTGGASGIGFGITHRLVEAGAQAVMCDIDPEKLNASEQKLKSLGLKVSGVVCDISDEGSVIDAVGNTVSQYGDIDIVVNNAGRYYQCALEEMPAEQWDSIYDTNVKGMFLMTRETVKVMEEKGHGGSVINISSVGATCCNILHMSHYHSSKAAQLGFTNHLAAELGPKGIRVNAIQPGATFVMTDENGDYLPVPDKPDSIPLVRLGTAYDVANAVLFLASDMASYITGVSIPVDGGLLKSPNFGYKRGE